MYQAITTKYLGPTNHRGARVVARADAGKVTVPWNYRFGPADNHALAAKELALKLGWHGGWHGGSTDTGYCFVPAPSRPAFAAEATDAA